MTRGGDEPGGGLTAADLVLLARVLEGNEWLRALLCTLARRGTLIRQREPERAVTLLDELSRWPWFKGGQFLFDLMEWEDFMVDGPAPPLLSSALGSHSLRRFGRALTAARALMDDAVGAAVGEAQAVWDQLSVEIATAEESLPELQPGLYLYRDVVLGVVISAGPILQAGQQVSHSLDRPGRPGEGARSEDGP